MVNNICDLIQNQIRIFLTYVLMLSLDKRLNKLMIRLLGAQNGFPNGFGAPKIYKPKSLSINASIIFICVLISAIFIFINNARAQAIFGQVLSYDEIETYNRMVIQFEPMPEYDIYVDSSILTVSFKQAVDLDYRKFSKIFAQKFSSVRLSPDMKSISFGLKNNIKVNSMEAGRNLYIDLLPENWQGQYPSLPREVINALSERLRNAENNLEIIKHGEPSKELEIVELYVSDLPELSRLSFNWNNPVQVEVKQKDDLVRIEFDRKGKIDIGELKVNPPNNIGDSDFLKDLRKTILLLKLRDGVKVRYSVNNNKIIVVDFFPEEAGTTIKPSSELFDNIAKNDPNIRLENNRSEARIEDKDLDVEEGFEIITPDILDSENTNSNLQPNGNNAQKASNMPNVGPSEDFTQNVYEEEVQSQEIYLQDENMANNEPQYSYNDLENLDNRYLDINDAVPDNSKINYIRSQPINENIRNFNDEMGSARIYEKDKSKLSDLIGEVTLEDLSNAIYVENLGDNPTENIEDAILGELNKDVTIYIKDLPKHIIGEAIAGNFDYEDFDQDKYLNDYQARFDENLAENTAPSPENVQLAKKQEFMEDNGSAAVEDKFSLTTNNDDEVNDIKVLRAKPDQEFEENIGFDDKVDRKIREKENDKNDKPLDETSFQASNNDTAPFDDDKNELRASNVNANIDPVLEDDLDVSNIIKSDINDNKEEDSKSPNEVNIENKNIRKMEPNTVVINDSAMGTEVEIDIDPRYVGHSVFKRGNNIYVVLDSDNTIDLDQFDKFNTNNIVINIENKRFNNWQYLKFKVSDDVLFSLKDIDEKLVLLIGNPEGRPIGASNFNREIDSEGLQQLIVKLPNIKNVHWIKDELFEDNLAVITVTNLSIGIISRKEFVDFALLPTEIGAVVLPYSDNLQVKVSDEYAYISKPDGLNISLLKDKNNKLIGSVNKYKTDGFEFIAEFNNDKILRTNLNKYLDELIEKTASDDKIERVNNLILLSNAYLNNGFGAEGLAYLKMAEEEDRKLSLFASQNAMKAYGNYLEARYDKMQENLRDDSLANDPHLSFWEGLLAEKQNKYDEAFKKLMDNKVLENFYPEFIKKDYLFALLNAAINTDNLQEAEINLIELGQYDLDQHEAEKLSILKAKYFIKSEQIDEARKILGKMLKSNNRDIEVEERVEDNNQVRRFRSEALSSPGSNILKRDMEIQSTREDEDEEEELERKV